MIQYVFDEDRSIQAAARFIALNGGQLNYMILIKFLYLADRRSLELYDEPITGDEPCSMKHGPVLSRICDWIRHSPKTARKWLTYIKTDGYSVNLIADPGTDDLSRADNRIIEETYNKWYPYVNERYPFDFTDGLLHEILPEWIDPQDSILPIDKEYLLAILGKSPQTIQSIEAQQQEEAEVRRVLSNCH